MVQNSLAFKYHLVLVRRDHLDLLSLHLVFGGYEAPSSTNVMKISKSHSCGSYRRMLHCKYFYRMFFELLVSLRFFPFPVLLWLDINIY